MENERTPPTSFLLLKFGGNVYTKDGKEGTFEFDDACADALIAEFESRSRDLVIDFEHATLSGREAPAAGWIDRLEKDAEGLRAHVKYWTDKAEEYLSRGEYRYFSPTIILGGDKRAAALHSVALTNHPALHGVDALVANDTAPAPDPGGQKQNLSDMPDRSDMSDEKRKEPTMTETENALRKLLGEETLALTDTADTEIARRLTALADELPTLREKAAKCDELQAAEVEKRKLELFDRGVKRGAFCNAQKTTLLKLSLADLEEHEKNTPDNAALPPPLPKPEEERSDTPEALSDEEKKIAAKMGLTDAQFAEIKKQFCAKEENE